MKRSSLWLTCWLAACSQSGHEAPQGAAAMKREGPAALETVAVEAQRLSTTVQLSGELTPYESVALFPRVQGFLEQIRVDRGSIVKSGQILGRLSAPELLSQRAEAEAKAHADESTLQRLRATAATPGAVSKHEIELAEAAAHASQSRVHALAALEAYLVLKAPFDGVVTERNVHPGALIGPPAGTNAVPMLRIEQAARLRLNVAVPEAYIGSVQEGIVVEFTVLAWPGALFSGNVQRVARSFTPSTRTMPVELDVENSAGKLASGMFVEVKWPVRRESPSLFVPNTAVVRTTERTFVSRVKDETLEQVPVQLGAAMGDRLEVFGALQAGERILKRGREELPTGVRVQTQPTAGAKGTP